MSSNEITELATIAVPGTTATIAAKLIDGKPFIALGPMCESLGIDAKSQREKLHAKSWATGVLSTSVVSHRKRRNADHPHFVKSFQSQGVSA